MKRFETMSEIEKDKAKDLENEMDKKRKVGLIYHMVIVELLVRIIKTNPDFAAFAYKSVRVKEEDVPKYYGLAERVYRNFLWLDLTQYKKEDLTEQFLKNFKGGETYEPKE